MNHYIFYFNVTLSLDRDDDCSDDDRSVSIVSHSSEINNKLYIDEIVNWYQDLCNIYDDYYEYSNGYVKYDSSRECYVLELDMDGSYEDAKFLAEILVNPNEDGNYPIELEGVSYLIFGELCDEYNNNSSDDDDYDDDDDKDDEDTD